MRPESFECSRPEIGRERGEGFSSRHCQVDDEKCALPPHEGRAPQPRPPTIPKGELREWHDNSTPNDDPHECARRIVEALKARGLWPSNGAHAMAAIEHMDLFERANVGLASVDRAERVKVWHVPEPALPFSPSYARSVARKLLASNKTKVNNLAFIRSVRGGSRLAALRGWRLLVHLRSAGIFSSG